MLIEAVCSNSNCQKPIRKYVEKEYSTYFCNKACFDAHKKAEFKTNCSHCGAELTRNRSQITKNNVYFCNQHCNNEYKKSKSAKVITNCSHCGTQIRKRPTKSGYYFCNIECQKASDIKISLSDDHKKAISNSMIGMKFSEERNRKISEAKKAQAADISAKLKGRARPPEVIARIQATKAAKKQAATEAYFLLHGEMPNVKPTRIRKPKEKIAPEDKPVKEKNVKPKSIKKVKEKVVNPVKPKPERRIEPEINMYGEVVRNASVIPKKPPTKPKYYPGRLYFLSRGGF